MLIAKGITASQIFILFCIPFAVGIIICTIAMAIINKKHKNKG